MPSVENAAGPRSLPSSNMKTATSSALADAWRITARNRLKGKIVEVTKGQTTAHVRIDVNGAIVTASITNEAVDELRLAVGQTAYAVVKASDVMVAID